MMARSKDDKAGTPETGPGFSTINGLSKTCFDDLKKCPSPVVARPSEKRTSRFSKMIEGDKLIPCNKWECPVCSEKMRKSWRWWAWHKFEQDRKDGRVLAFMTLTIDPKRIPQGVEFNRYLQDSWNRFRALLFKRGVKIKYISIVEPHKAGGYHMHLIASFDKGFKGQRIIRPLWYKAGGGCQADYSKLKINDDQELKRSIGYVTKYMTKDIAKLPKAVKASQGYGIKSREYKETVKKIIEKKVPKEVEKTLDKKIEYLIYSTKTGNLVERNIKKKKSEKKKYQIDEIQKGTGLFKVYDSVLQAWDNLYKRKQNAVSRNSS